ncbi:MAG TPA: hypothetical protein VFJ58_28910 [Armatimonadota bacterium]|nr:hypothetical protein [Armatimonadota bacterium]
MNLPEFPNIPIYVLWVICALVLLVGARFRLTALLQAGSAPPGSGRTLRAARVLLLDLLTFAATSVLLKLQPFPLLMSAIILFALTFGLLWVQWFFNRGENKTSSGSLLIDGVQGLQTAALDAGYGKIQTWVNEEYRKNRWRLGLIYQLIMVAICVGLRVLNTLQGGWLYILFSLFWQSGITAVLYWRFDRRRFIPRPPGAPPSTVHPAIPGAAAPEPGTTGRPAGPPIWRRLPFSIPRPSGAPRRGAAPHPVAPRAVSPGATPPAPGAHAPRPSTRRRTKFSLRSDVQAFVAFSAGIWCGIFSLYLGWAYGFASVTAFRTLLSAVSPIASGLLGRYMPQPLQGYFKPAPKVSPWTLKYFRSRDFWYGPGMGLAGGILGAVARFLLFSR